LGVGVGGCGVGVGGWGPNPQSPIPNPQSPIPNNNYFSLLKISLNILINNKSNII